MAGFNDSNATYGADTEAVSDILNTGTGVQGILTVGTTAIEVKVNAAKLASRKSVTLFNNSAVTIYWGYTNAVTTATGTPIFKNQQVNWDVGDIQTIFVIAGTASNNTRVTEA